MHNTLEVKMQLQCQAEKKEGVWITSCPVLRVMSQGGTLKEAKDNLNEAIVLWLESCISRGVLHQALIEVGFEPIQSQKKRARKKVVAATSPTLREFPLTVNTPAYAGSSA